MFGRKEAALRVLPANFPRRASNVKVCGTCKSVLKSGTPKYATTFGYVSPPGPSCLPRLNAIEESLIFLIASRLPFTCIMRLSHGRGHHAIRGQIANVPIDVQGTLQTLPRHISDDGAVEVHIKRRLIHKPTYKSGVVKSGVHGLGMERGRRGRSHAAIGLVPLLVACPLCWREVQTGTSNGPMRPVRCPQWPS